MPITDLPTRSADYSLQLSILNDMKARRDELQAELAAVKAKITAQDAIVTTAKQQLKDAATAA